MATTAELEAQLAQLQRRIADLRLKYENNRNDFNEAQRQFFAAGAALRADPDNKALQQAQIEAEANFRQVAAEVKPVTDELNASLAQQRQLEQQIAQSGQSNAAEKEKEETTINPKTDPTVDKNKEPYTVRYDDGSSIYYNPQTGEEIVTTIDENGVAHTESRIIIPKASEDQAQEAAGGDTVYKPEQEVALASGAKDWRFRVSLSPYADYLYSANDPGILAPLVHTNGVIFPYSPIIAVSYTAAYTPLELTHSNYKLYNYRSSSVENISITGDFTAQDMVEANYLLAVIHFFKSVTKMFYGQDINPSRGVPPPLVYLQGYGQYQFDMHPVVITNFTLNFPQDVDYISAYPTNNGLSIGAKNLEAYINNSQSGLTQPQRLRAIGSKIQPGGLAPPPDFSSTKNINEETRVPTKIQIQLSCLPIVTRNAISNKFSLAEYATGRLMKGSTNPGTGGGIW